MSETRQQFEQNAAHKVTAAERAAMERNHARREAKSSIRLKVLENDEGYKIIALDHPNEAIGGVLCADALGTADGDFINGLLIQLADTVTMCSSELDEREPDLNFMFSVIKGVGPRDQLEAMLASQMAAVHMASLKSVRRLLDGQLNAPESAFIKLTRTFVMQMEALKRYRSGGEQKVMVQQVSIADGGQAIVANLTQAAGKKAPEEAAASAPPALPEGNVVPLPTMEANKERVPVLTRRKSKK
jgi:hypothetical protein